VVKGDARTLKENAIFIEQHHELGRFVDIDVYDVDEEYAVTRLELAYEPRKCFLCDEPAKECSRNKVHDVKDLIAFMEESIKAYQTRNR
jgi:holo-ACP synthase